MRLFRASYVLSGLLVLWFASLFYLSLGTAAVFLSPDENAAFTFARAFSQTGSFFLVESLNTEALLNVFPRSTIPVFGGLVPTTFLSFPAFLGFVMQIGGASFAYVVTPFLALCTVVAFYQMTWRVTRDRTTAHLASFIAAIHPALWYYSARPFMHNVAFAAFLVLSAWLVVYRPFVSSYARAGLAGLFLGLAFAIRPSEAPWILGTILLFTLISGWWRSWRFQEMLLGGVFFTLPLLGLFSLQEMTYGSPLSFGYLQTATVMSSEQVTTSAAIVQASFGQRVLAFLFPFGIHLSPMIKHAAQYGLFLYPLSSVLMVLGAALFLQAPSERRYRFAYVLSLAFASLWLIALYGSWTFNDNPDPFVVTVGNSYVRYFLPLFLFAAPLAAYAIRSIAQRCESFVPRVFVYGVFAATLLSWSIHVVFFGGDGLLQGRISLAASLQKRETILSLTEPEAVVIVDRADKFLFPYRRVVQPLRVESTYDAMPTLVASVPLYYFGITFPEKDLLYLNDEKLAADGLRIEAVQTIDDETLYRIFRK